MAILTGMLGGASNIVININGELIDNSQAWIEDELIPKLNDAYRRGHVLEGVN